MSLWFNGKSSDEMHVYVEHYPPYVAPKRKRTSLDAPGRTRRIYTDSGGAYENVTQPYDVYIHDRTDAKTLDQCMADITDWLLGPAGYCILTDSYNPDTYRMAVYTGPMDIKSYYNRFGRLTLNFDCDPRRFLMSGHTYTAYEDGDIIENPTSYDAEPLIAITSSGNCTITINYYPITLPAFDTQKHIYIDCDTGEIYDEEHNNMSDQIHVDPYPVLGPGTNTISITGNVTTLEIMPRWYVL